MRKRQQQQQQAGAPASQAHAVAQAPPPSMPPPVAAAASPFAGSPEWMPGGGPAEGGYGGSPPGVIHAGFPPYAGGLPGLAPIQDQHINPVGGRGPSPIQEQIFNPDSGVHQVEGYMSPRGDAQVRMPDGTQGGARQHSILARQSTRRSSCAVVWSWPRQSRASTRAPTLLCAGGPRQSEQAGARQHNLLARQRTRSSSCAVI